MFALTVIKRAFLLALAIPGLAAAVTAWDQPPVPLVPLYLRRPDAKTLAERGLVR